MLVALHAAAADHDTFVQRGVVTDVHHSDVVALHERSEHGQIGLIAGGQHGGSFFSQKARKSLFKDLVQDQSSVEEARTRARSTKFADGASGSFANLRVGREA